MDRQAKPKLDTAIEQYYSKGKEQERLNEHPLERDRTLMILKKMMPRAPAVVLDIGGAAGAYAFPLTSQGYEVHLIDPVPLHIEQALNFECISSIKLASCSIGDARHIEREDQCADVILLFGPLYHLTSQSDRLKVLKESHRLLKPGGILFAVGISRFATFMDSVYKEVFGSKKEIIERELVTGIHHKIAEEFDFGYLHTSSELKNEIEQSGFQAISILAIEGPVWHKELMANLWENQNQWKSLLSTIEKIETEESIIGASAHIMAVAQV